MNENKSPRTFSGRAMRAVQQDLEGAMPSDQDNRLADLVYETMSSINHAEEDIRREVRTVRYDLDQINEGLASGLRLRTADATRLNEAVKKRQRGFDLLVALLGEDEVKRYQQMR